MGDTTWITIDDTPDIPDLAFRHFRDDSDFAGLVGVIEVCQEYDQVDPLSSEAGLPSVEELSRSFSEADNIDLETDLLVTTQKLIGEFSQLLLEVTESIEDDGKIEPAEADRIRQAWETLKGSAEAFAVAAERGIYFSDDEPSG